MTKKERSAEKRDWRGKGNDSDRAHDNALAEEKYWLMIKQNKYWLMFNEIRLTDREKAVGTHKKQCV